MDDDALEAIRQAERIVWAAGWHLQEQSVLRQLAGTRGLVRARLDHAPTSSSSSPTTASTSGTCGGKGHPGPSSTG